MKSLLSSANIKKHMVLLVIWGTVIVTGFLALGAMVGGIESLIVFSRMHSLAVRFGLVYTVVHIFQHRHWFLQCIKNLTYKQKANHSRILQVA